MIKKNQLNVRMKIWQIFAVNGDDKPHEKKKSIKHIL